MTYGNLYSQATTWTARHVAYDLLLMCGGKTEASAHDIEKVNSWQVKEGGEKIALDSKEAV